MGCLITSGITQACEYSVGGVTSPLWMANHESIESWTQAVGGEYNEVVFANTTALTDVTNANPAQVTAAGHGLNGGDKILIVGTSPMDGLIGQHEVDSVIDADNFTLLGFDSTSLAAFAGTVATVQPDAFYAIQFLAGNASATNELQKSNGNKYFQASVNFKAGGFSQALKELMDELGISKCVFVVKLKNGKYIIVGKLNGLEADTLTFTSGAESGDFQGFETNMLGEELENTPEWDNTVNGLPVFTS